MPLNFLPLATQRFANLGFSNFAACTRLGSFINSLPTNTFELKNAVFDTLTRREFRQDFREEEANRILSNLNPDSFADPTLQEALSPTAQRFDNLFDVPEITDIAHEDRIFLTDGDYQISLPILENKITLTKRNDIRATITNNPKEPLTPEQSLDPNIADPEGTSGTIKRIVNTGDWTISISFIVYDKDRQFVSFDSVAGINYFSKLTRSFQIQSARTSIHEIDWVAFGNIRWSEPNASTTHARNALLCTITLFSDETRRLRDENERRTQGLQSPPATATSQETPQPALNDSPGV